MTYKITSERTWRELTVGDIGYLVNAVTATVMQFGGLAAAILPVPIIGLSENPTRDGLLIFTAGTVIKGVQRGVEYAHAIYERNKP